MKKILTVINVLFFSCALFSSDWKVQKKFYKAITLDNAGQIKFMLKADPSLVNQQIKYYSYPIIEAARFGAIKTLRLLVEKGADIQQKEKGTGNTVLHAAVSNLGVSKEKRNAVFDYLINEKKFKIDILNKNRQTPFNFAFTSTPYPPSVANGTAAIELFEKYKADFNTKDPDGRTAVNYLARVKLGTDPAKNELRGPALAKLMIEKGADVNITDKDKRTPLVSFLVVCKKVPEDMKIDFVTFLMKHGANIRIKSKKKERALKLVNRKSRLYKIMKKKYKKK